MSKSVALAWALSVLTWCWAELPRENVWPLNRVVADTQSLIWHIVQTTWNNKYCILSDDRDSTSKLHFYKWSNWEIATYEWFTRTTHIDLNWDGDLDYSYRKGEYSDLRNWFPKYNWLTDDRNNRIYNQHMRKITNNCIPSNVWQQDIETIISNIK